MYKKAYLEITNVCNLSCTFCHGTKRPPRFITEEEFRVAAEKLRGVTEYLYFHLMGEPLLHTELEKLLNIAAELKFKVIITTNGTLFKEKGDVLLNAPSLHKVSISLHCYEANRLNVPAEEYLASCFDFCKKASQKGIISVMRLWNIGGEESLNDRIIGLMHNSFPEEWKETYFGFKIRDRVFLEWGEKFEWPDLDADSVGSEHSCYGLRDQIGVLCDGTVVPCCLDADGAVNLGNIFCEDIESIVSSPRAENIKRGFEAGRACEELCRKCGFAAKFTLKK